MSCAALDLHVKCCLVDVKFLVGTVKNKSPKMAVHGMTYKELFVTGTLQISATCVLQHSLLLSLGRTALFIFERAIAKSIKIHAVCLVESRN